MLKTTDQQVRMLIHLSVLLILLSMHCLLADKVPAQNTQSGDREDMEQPIEGRGVHVTQPAMVESVIDTRKQEPSEANRLQELQNQVCML